MTDLATSVDTLLSQWDWQELRSSLVEHGYAVTPEVLSAKQCEDLVGLYDEPEHWRSRVDMARHRFGSGEYKYFANPLPETVADLRTAFYPRLAPLANTWNEQLRFPDRFPDELDDFLDRCHAAGQVRPTPLLLQYQAGGYNCLHQDIYGEHAFPLQVMVALSRPGEDYTGGEFLLVENLPRAQSRGTAVSVGQGQAVIWPTRFRPGVGSRGFYRITVRHGVSVIRTGHRHTLGVIFHDAT
ncbi:2OG-Fe(II) oxygenase [Solihabitans fulvus]|uniref:2OG-Fe(II) oxygenase n=1 Tax=Solihabitans fulvus TaxID=1892852 RepID=A0A5B2X7Y5_9PSEU|nr:2OG-Fe(II) oxygenase [Solihabitans fulvus]KAA2259394.1 2OG-Fe(II) oxygenase [Solihabitans fulvus]